MPVYSSGLFNINISYKTSKLCNRFAWVVKDMNVVLDEAEAAEKPTKEDTVGEVRRLSCGETALLAALQEGRRRTGRFLTVHKRRRRRLTTRALHDLPALLDDLQHGNVQVMY